MAADDPILRVRVPDKLREKVKAAATANNRSASAEVLARLEASFTAVGELEPEFMLQRFRNLEWRLAQLEHSVRAHGVDILAPESQTESGFEVQKKVLRESYKKHLQRDYD